MRKANTRDKNNKLLFSRQSKILENVRHDPYYNPVQETKEIIEEVQTPTRNYTIDELITEFYGELGTIARDRFEQERIELERDVLIRALLGEEYEEAREDNRSNSTR